MATEYGIKFIFGPNHMFAKDSIEIYKKFKWGNPLDWSYRTSIEIKFYTEIENDVVDWLKNNCVGSWRLSYWVISRNAILQFSRLEDAMAYKLRWM